MVYVHIYIYVYEYSWYKCNMTKCAISLIQKCVQHVSHIERANMAHYMCDMYRYMAHISMYRYMAHIYMCNSSLHVLFTCAT